VAAGSAYAFPPAPTKRPLGSTPTASCSSPPDGAWSSRAPPARSRPIAAATASAASAWSSALLGRPRPTASSRSSSSGDGTQATSSARTSSPQPRLHPADEWGDRMARSQSGRRPTAWHTGARELNTGIGLGRSGPQIPSRAQRERLASGQRLRCRGPTSPRGRAALVPGARRPGPRLTFREEGSAPQQHPSVRTHRARRRTARSRHFACVARLVASCLRRTRSRSTHRRTGSS
jgi:hypothetical protein